jgi:hypothetical protein
VQVLEDVGFAESHHYSPRAITVRLPPDIRPTAPSLD